MKFAWLYEWLEQNNVPPGLFVMLLITVFLTCMFIICKVGDKPLLVDRCKDCVYFRQYTSSHYLCYEYKMLLFPWSKKQSPCPVEERWKSIEFPPLAAYETRKKEIAESAEPIEGVFYLYDGRIIPDYYSECLFSDKDNPLRAEMYHHEFYCHYMRQRFADLISSNEKSIPRGRIAGTLSDPVIYIDKCYEQDMDTLRQLQKLYHLSDVSIMPNSNYRCSTCYDKR